jgi:phosphoribosylformylglycinamidine synthase
MQGENKSELDFNAVQRGDAEMEQKMNRVIRACCELGTSNPIVSIHDQGAGGNCNVLKEIIAPAGGRIEVRSILVGDSSLSVLEIWGAEYQEADALLIRASSQQEFSLICARERVSVAYVGSVTGDGRAVLHDSIDDTCPVDMDLEKVLGHMPQKTFKSERQHILLPAFHLPADVTVSGALDRVLRLLSVGSKRFLTNKVDRSVTGLVAQQQCVGPLQTPLSNYAVIAHSYFAHTGIATSIGEQPIKSLVSPSAMARMAVAESITNMMGARITALSDAKCSANWMWAAKLPHEGAALYDACEAMCSFMIDVGVAVDGGKDSLSMAAKAPDGELVKAPGSLVISLYCPCPDFRKNVTPDLKAPGSSSLVFVDLSASLNAPSRMRVGASALSHVYGALGDESQVPDCNDAALLVRAFGIVQLLLDTGSLLSLHDRSDGGLIITALEMAFAGNCGFDLRLPPVATSPAEVLFNEELGVLLEVSNVDLEHVLTSFESSRVRASVIGTSTVADLVSIHIGDACMLSARMTELRDIWEATSFQLERRQCNPACVASEESTMKSRTAPPFKLTFSPTLPASGICEHARHRVAVLREEGSNGDREMSAALLLAGFDVWDITMSDLVDGRAKIDEHFRGLVFPGGFSYADVLDSAKGWAATIRFHPGVLEQLTTFYRRPDTFSLGVCNGCQLLALLGWVPFGPLGSHEGIGVTDVTQPRFVHNASGRFESRFSTVKINDSPAIMFRGMQGSVLGVWVAHGEGQVHFEDPQVLNHVASHNLIPLSYVDDAAEPTQTYPFNPNGSQQGIAGLVTPDGRHLAIMPHPERVHRLWQWPWMPREWKQLPESPWMQMFRNAKEWCDTN